MGSSCCTLAVGGRFWFFWVQGKDEEEMFTNLKVRTRLLLLTAVAAVALCVIGIMNMSGKIGRAHV